MCVMTTGYPLKNQTLVTMFEKISTTNEHPLKSHFCNCNKIAETLSSSGIHCVYVWKIKQSTPLPSLLHSKFGCLLFSTGSLNSSTTLHEGVGRGEALFSAFMLAKS